MTPELAVAARQIRCGSRLVFFTGAGISAESQIPTFRDDSGFWNRFPIETYGTWGGLVTSSFLRPKQVAAFVAAVLGPIANALPNAAHQAIQELEQRFDVTVITQNIDGLHQAAGTTRVVELHGSIFEINFLRGNGRTRLGRADLLKVVQMCQGCNDRLWALPGLVSALRPILGVRGMNMRYPAVTLFGQELPKDAWTLAETAIGNCDSLVVVGTSGVVYPAALLPRMARQRRVPVIGIGPEQGDWDIWLRGSAGIVLPSLRDAVLT